MHLGPPMCPFQGWNPLSVTFLASQDHRPISLYYFETLCTGEIILHRWNGEACAPVFHWCTTLVIPNPIPIKHKIIQDLVFCAHFRQSEWLDLSLVAKRETWQTTGRLCPLGSPLLISKLIPVSRRSEFFETVRRCRTKGERASELVWSIPLSPSAFEP